MKLKEQADLAEGMRWVGEVKRLRADLARVRRETLEEVAEMAEEIDGTVDGVDGAGPILPISFTEFAAAIRSLASTPCCRAGHAWQESVGYCDATGCDQPLASTPEAP